MKLFTSLEFTFACCLQRIIPAAKCFATLGTDDLLLCKFLAINSDQIMLRPVGNWVKKKCNFSMGNSLRLLMV